MLDPGDGRWRGWIAGEAAGKRKNCRSNTKATFKSGLGEADVVILKNLK